MTSQPTMRAAVMHGFGGTDVFSFDEVPMPAPDARQVRIKVEAAGVNFAEMGFRRGDYPTPFPKEMLLPCILGTEVTGIVDTVGSKVTGISVGDHIGGVLDFPGGGYAEYAVAEAEKCFPIPAGMTAPEALALMVQGQTARVMTQMHPFNPGDSVLVHVAAGGVGSLLLQICKVMGAGVLIATCGGPEKAAQVAALGAANYIVDYSRPDWHEQVMTLTNGGGVHMIYDSLGGVEGDRNFDLLAVRGKIVIYGGVSGRPSLLDADSAVRFVVANRVMAGLSLPMLDAMGTGQALRDLMDLREQGSLKVITGSSFPLSAVAEAHDAIAARKTSGKVVLVP